MDRRALKRRASKFASVKLLNPVMRRALEAGVVPRGWALLETTGRRSGQPRRVPVGNGLRGAHFWIVPEHGRKADYGRTLQAAPRVRVKGGGGGCRAPPMCCPTTTRATACACSSAR